MKHMAITDLKISTMKFPFKISCGDNMFEETFIEGYAIQIIEVIPEIVNSIRENI
jgi:RNAse (barnase) inhibitor barstar